MTEINEADALVARAAELDREAEALRERARELRADRRTHPLTIVRISETTGIPRRVLRDAAVSGALVAYRAGGAERGEIVTTLAAVDAWLSTQPARAVRLVPSPVDDVAASVAAAAARIARRR